MILLLVILSVLALLALLGTLVFGLLFILSALQGIRTHLEKITMGVRAIEHQVQPLGRRTRAVAASLTLVGEAAGNIAAGLAETDRRLAAAEPALRTRE
jgi:adenylosuccinate lyase